MNFDEISNVASHEDCLICKHLDKCPLATHMAMSMYIRENQKEIKAFKENQENPDTVFMFGTLEEIAQIESYSIAEVLGYLSELIPSLKSRLEFYNQFSFFVITVTIMSMAGAIPTLDKKWRLEWINKAQVYAKSMENKED